MTYLGGVLPQCTTCAYLLKNGTVGEYGYKNRTLEDF
jgi:hypothetical protein